MNNIKFKSLGKDIFVKILLNENGSEKSRDCSFSSNPKPKTSGFGMNKEMKAWIADGNKIEDQYTDEELSKKESDDLKSALESQKQTCIQLLNDSEKSVSNDPPYPDDVETWKTARSQWRNILKSDTIQTIPEKPF